MEMSGVKKKDLINEGWISFLDGVDLEYEYTLKEYYLILREGVKMHCMYGQGKKYKPGFPLYERYNEPEFVEKTKEFRK